MHSKLVWIWVVTPLACARAPEPAPEPVLETPTGDAAPREPDPPTPATVAHVGDDSRRAATLAGLAGVWAFEREVWQIEGERVQVYRPADAAADVPVERRLELLAPCMFVVHEGERTLGPYQVDVRPDRLPTWARGGVAVARVDHGVYTLCEPQHVFEVDGDRCQAWRYDATTHEFDARALACERVRTYPADDSIEVHPAQEEWIVRLRDDPNAQELLVDYRIHAGPTGEARSAPNLGSACGALPAAHGCTLAQAELLRSLHWAADDGACTGSALRVEFELLFENTRVDGPRRCLLASPPGEPAFALEPGVVEVSATPSVRAGSELELEFVFENADAETRFVRIPTGMWNVAVTRRGKPVDVGTCLGGVGSWRNPGANAAEFRLAPGGTLTVAVPWSATGEFTTDDGCEVRPLRKGTYEVAFELERDPTIVLRKQVRVES